MTEFKKGDIVEAIETCKTNGITLGRQYEVTRAEPAADPSYWFLAFIDDKGYDGGCFSHRVKKVQPLVITEFAAHPPSKNLTKIESYIASKSDHPKQEARIADALRQWSDISRREISILLDIRLSSVCVGVNSLLKKGVLKVSGIAFDRETGRNVETLAIA